MVVSGVALNYDKDQISNVDLLKENLRHLDYKAALAEVIYKNTLSNGHLSAN